MSTVTHPIVLAFHGTRHPDGEPTAHAIAAAVSQELGGAQVHVAWVDLHRELLHDFLPTVGPCTVVPCFLAAGFHVTHDVASAAAASPYPVTVTPHLGARESLCGVLAALSGRIAEAGGPGDALVLAAIGSRMAAAQAEIDAVAVRLADLWNVPVRPGFIFSGQPQVAAVADDLRTDGHRDLLMVPYTIAPGLFGERLRGLTPRLTAPLGPHPALVSAIAARVAPRIGVGV
ncbi:MAG: sirohydrochlorin chelatase [Propioniciclava sp.]